MADIFVDNVVGSNSNPGTEALPKKNLSGAKAKPAVPGDRILLAAGQCHDTSGSGFFPTWDISDLYFGGYGAGAKPVLDGMHYEVAGSAGWALADSVLYPGLWVKTIGTSNARGGRVMRLWAGATKTGNLRSQRAIGTERRRAAGDTDVAQNLAALAATVDAVDIWRHGGPVLGWNKLYVYTGSNSVNPPDHYGGLALLVTDGSTIGCAQNMLFRQCSNIVVDGLEGWGSSSSAFRVSSSTTDTNPCTNIEFRNCDARYWFENGLKAAPGTSPTNNPRVEISGIRAIGCHFDPMTSEQAQETDKEKYDYLSGAMDAISFVDSVRDAWAIDCTVHNSMHVAFVLGKYSSNLESLLTDNCGFIRCKGSWDTWHAYGRGFTTYDCSPSCALIDCVLDGQNVRSQMAGAPLIDRMVFKNMRLCTRKTNVSQAIAVTAELLDRGTTTIGTNRYVRVEAHGARVRDTIIMAPKNDAFIFETYLPYSYGVAEPVIADDAVEISNCIIYDTARTGSTIRMFSNATTIGAQRIRNVAVWKGSGNPAPTVSIQNVSYGVNASPGCINNITTDPLLDTSNPAKFMLGAASPCRSAGAFTGLGSEDGLLPCIGPFAASSSITV